MESLFIQLSGDASFSISKNGPLWLFCGLLIPVDSLLCDVDGARPRRRSWRAPPVGPGSALSGCPAHRACYTGCGHRSCPSLCCTDPPPSAARRLKHAVSGQRRPDLSGPQLWEQTDGHRVNHTTLLSIHNTTRLTGARASEDWLYWPYTAKN